MAPPSPPCLAPAQAGGLVCEQQPLSTGTVRRKNSARDKAKPLYGRDTQAGPQRLTGCDFFIKPCRTGGACRPRTGFGAFFYFPYPLCPSSQALPFPRPQSPASLVPTLAHLAWGPQLLPRVTVPWLTLECRPSLSLHKPPTPLPLPLPLPGPSPPGWQGGCGGASVQSAEVS